MLNIWVNTGIVPLDTIQRKVKDGTVETIILVDSRTRRCAASRKKQYKERRHVEVGVTSKYK